MFAFVTVNGDVESSKRTPFWTSVIDVLADAKLNINGSYLVSFLMYIMKAMKATRIEKSEKAFH